MQPFPEIVADIIVANGYFAKHGRKTFSWLLLHLFKHCHFWMNTEHHFVSMRLGLEFHLPSLFLLFIIR